MARGALFRMEHYVEEVAPPARVRGLFPETLLWRPQLVTDDQGRASRSDSAPAI